MFYFTLKSCLKNNSMTKKISLLLLIAFINSFTAISQNISFQHNGQNVSYLVIPADSTDTEYTITAILPTENIEYTYWSVSGGIEVVDSTDTEITIRCKSGNSYTTKYSKYAYGEIVIHAKKVEEEVSEECASCEMQDCNPYYKASINIYKTFDWSGNKIVGDNCISAGDSVTYSVAPWISLLYYTSNEYYWNIPEDLRASDLYYSADGSSVTFVASENIEGQTISVEIGKYNLDSGQDALTLTTSRDIDIPQIDGMIECSYYCLPFKTDTFTLIINNASEDALYEWDVLSWTSTISMDNSFRIWSYKII